MEERKVTVAEKFKHKGVQCVIARADWMLSSIGTYHNGYVEVNGTPKYNKVKVSEELTFSGNLKHLDKKLKGWFVGFDTAHYWNTIHRKSQTQEAVKKATRELCDELIKLGIAKQEV